MKIEEIKELLVDVVGHIVDRATLEECRDKNSDVAKLVGRLNEADQVLSGMLPEGIDSEGGSCD